MFGGQVIPQALVSATNSVDPSHALHVRILLYWLVAWLSSLHVRLHYFGSETLLGYEKVLLSAQPLALKTYHLPCGDTPPWPHLHHTLCQSIAARKMVFITICSSKPQNYRSFHTNYLSPPMSPCLTWSNPRRSGMKHLFVIINCQSFVRASRKNLCLHLIASPALKSRAG